MNNSLHFSLWSSPTGAQVFDMTPWLTGLRFGNGPRGFGALDATAVLTKPWAFWLYERINLYAVVAWQGAVVWEGRVEDVAMRPEGLALKAFGYWRALSDVPYSGLWSSTSVAGFRATTSNDVANRTPEKYAMDTINRLFIALRKNETYANNAEAGDYTLAAPHLPDRNIVEVEFTYEMLLPLDWDLALQSRNYDFSGFASEWNLAATGVLQTGTVTVTLASAKDRIAFRIINLTGGAYTWAGETGAAYAKITNLRVKGTASAALYADEIARALVTFVNGVNSSQLSTVSGLINSPAVDLNDEVYQDALPADVLSRLASLGDNATPPNQWEVGVWEDQRLHLRQRGAEARTWYLDVASPDLERTMEMLKNSVYGVYQEPGGAALRTAINADALRAVRDGVTRRAAVSVSSTSATQAGVQRDALLADSQDPTAQAGVRASVLYDASGGQYPAFLARSGDVAIIRNWPPTLSTDVDRLRVFRIGEVQYDVMSNEATLAPERPAALLEQTRARRAAGIRPAQFI